MSSLKFTFIILNYKSYSRTYKCLRKVLKLEGNFNVVVVDNFKASQEFMLLQNKFNSNKLFFVSSGENKGYSSGNNFGLNYAKKKNILGEYIIILNNDVDLEKDFLRNTTKTIKELPDFGCFSPKIIHKQTGNIQGPYNRDTLFKHLFEALIPPLGKIRAQVEQRKNIQITKTRSVYRTMGCCLILKTEVFFSVKLFDEYTFLGSEEEILSEKLKQINLKTYHVPSFSVVHDHGYTTKKTSRSEIEKYFRESKLYYFKEYLNYSPLELSIINISLIVKDFWRSLQLK